MDKQTVDYRLRLRDLTVDVHTDLDPDLKDEIPIGTVTINRALPCGHEAEEVIWIGECCLN